MKAKKTVVAGIWGLLGMATLHAEGVATLDSCRAMALRNNKEMRIGEAEREAAMWDRKAAFTNYLPKVSVLGGYSYTSRQLSLLSDDQKTALTHAGDNLPIVGEMVNGAGGYIKEQFDTDTRNAVGAAALLTQPLYMGGKIRAYHQITKELEALAEVKNAKTGEDITVAVDEAYWQVVELGYKRNLALQYIEMVKKLEHDVGELVREGMTTEADKLTVRVKRNEADVTLIQVENGLKIRRMQLEELCGLPMEGTLRVADEGAEKIVADNALSADETEAWGNRREIKMLEIAAEIDKEKIRIARSEFLPNVALLGGYVATYPSVFNGFQLKMKGLWTVGVTVKVPVVTWGERLYKVRAAKARAARTGYKLEAAKEKIGLQVNRCGQKRDEAVERLRATESGIEAASENLRYAQVGMAEGVMTLAQVVEAQTAWLNAQTAHLAAMVDVKMAEVYLRQSMGLVAEE